MKRRVPQMVSLCLLAGLVVPVAQGFPVFAAETEAVAETDGETVSETAVGELIFAQCEGYVNIREEASTDSKVTAKIYNNDSATVVAVEDGWYEITSGNAHGYVKAEYFATGEEAEAIAEEVAYNVAKVEVTYLNIRSEASSDSECIDVATENDEIEVVLYGDDWMKVALGNDVYGYIKADYVEYVTYYPVAETLEEEAARLAAESAEAETVAETEAETEAVQAESSDTLTETEAAETYSETEAVQAETYAETEAVQTEATAETEAVAETETVAETEAVQTETTAETETVAETETYAETEAVQTETTAETEAVAETEAAQTETTAETEAVQTETTTETEASSDTDSSSASTGESIASYAQQFIGNPYVYGGTSLTSGADCSGFVQSVFANFGISLSRTAAAQSGNGTSVSLSEIQAGDLLFYSSDGSSIDHVAIYIGGGMIVHAANSTRGICTDSAYYTTPVCARRCY